MPWNFPSRWASEKVQDDTHLSQLNIKKNYQVHLKKMRRRMLEKETDVGAVFHNSGFIPCFSRAVCWTMTLLMTYIAAGFRPVIPSDGL